MVNEDKKSSKTLKILVPKPYFSTCQLSLTKKKKEIKKGNSTRTKYNKGRRVIDSVLEILSINS